MRERWNESRLWEILQEANTTSQLLHPAYDREQHLINKRAEELIAERGLVPLEEEASNE